tara:strand:- start:732 stop:1712 length:981 start_codon:yes stop_codon:yes gene_type:complete
MRLGVLVTGFTIFSNHKENISQEILNLISVEGISGLDVETALLSVDEEGSTYTASRIYNHEKFSAIIHLGFSENSEHIRLERFAKNNYEMAIPDNSGRLKDFGKISHRGELVLETTAPKKNLEEMTYDFEEVIWSEDAGGFVCNETYYRSLEAASKVGSIPILFIHLPSAEKIPIARQLEVVKHASKIVSQRPQLMVVSALILDSRNRVLACRRPPGDSWAGWWEFPGGKVEDDEIPIEAISREVMEELQVKVEPSRLIDEIKHRYEDKDIHMLLWHCGNLSIEEISPSEHDKTRWLSRNELLEVKWLPADLPIIENWYRSGIPLT